MWFSVFSALRAFAASCCVAHTHTHTHTHQHTYTHTHAHMHTQTHTHTHDTHTHAHDTCRRKLQLEGRSYDMPKGHDETPEDVQTDSLWCNTPAHRRKAAKDNAPM